MGNFVLEKTQGANGRSISQVVLKGEVTIATAAQLRATLIDALEQCQKVTLDGSRVTELDLAGLQVLCSLHRTAAASGKSVEISGLEKGSWPEVLKASGLSRHEACADFPDNSHCLWML